MGDEGDGSASSGLGLPRLIVRSDDLEIKEAPVSAPQILDTLLVEVVALFVSLLDTERSGL